MARPGAILVVAAVLAWPARGARADESTRARADARARRGYDLAQARELEPAIAEFKQALAIEQRAIYLCNIGLAYSELGRPHRAHWFLDQCLERWSETEDDPIDPRITRYITDTVDRLTRGRYGRVRFRVEPAAATISIPAVFAADEAVRPRRIVWLPAGRHSVRITGNGFRPIELAVDVARGEQREVDIALEPVSAARSSPAAEVDRPPRASEPPGLRGPVTVLAIGAAALVAGGVSHAIALDRRSTASDLPPGREFDAADSSYRRWRAATVGLYAGGAIAVGLGTWWFLSRRRQRARHPELSGSAGADHALVSAGWRF